MLTDCQVLRSPRSTGFGRLGNMIPCMSAAMLFIAAAFSVAAHAEEHVASSLGTDVPFDKHICRHYGTNEGLPSNWVNDVMQSRDGFVWIATDNGLVRYDGAEFKLITPASTQQSPRSEVRVLYEDQRWGDLDRHLSGTCLLHSRLSRTPRLGVGNTC